MIKTQKQFSQVEEAGSETMYRYINCRVCKTCKDQNEKRRIRSWTGHGKSVSACGLQRTSENFQLTLDAWTSNEIISK